ncbi:hypothetical protein [Paracoccus sp. MC1854]|uniref:hypothetical protein n=1 Tax=Paracoccus sp. MC1854 TaxID=2760306 RepID=UPI001C71A2C5|nr:hypothetical protein [Paracoccus sp. MC1854]
MATVDVDQVAAPEPRDALTAGRLVLLASLAALGALATNIMLPAFPAMAIATLAWLRAIWHGP